MNITSFKSSLINFKAYYLLILVSIISQIYFFYYSEGWMLDDGMIIATLVRNFQNYGILTYDLSDILGTATSPIFAFFAGIISKTNLSAITSLKVLGGLCLIIISFYAYDLSKRYLKHPYNLLPPALILLFPQNIAYSQAGLPTFFYSLLVFLCLFNLFEQNYKYSFIFAGLSLTTRPDAILLFILIFYYCYKDKKISKITFLYFIYSILLYFSYLILHYYYYDSFFPHTIFAKNIQFPFGSWSILHNTLKYLNRMFIERWYMNPLYILSILGYIKLYSLNNRFIIFILWWFFYHGFHFIRIPLYSWYLIPPMPVLLFFSAFGIHYILNYLISIDKLKKYLLFFNIFIFLLFIIPYSKDKQLFSYHNKIVLKGIGDWLNQNKQKNESVLTETLGFIGYYSSMKVYDFPGLANRNIPELIKNHMKGYEPYDKIIKELKPTFLALRYGEWENLSNDSKINYKIKQKFISPNNISHNYLIAKINP